MISRNDSALAHVINAKRARNSGDVIGPFNIGQSPAKVPLNTPSNMNNSLSTSLDKASVPSAHSFRIYKTSSIFGETTNPILDDGVSDLVPQILVIAASNFWLLSYWKIHSTWCERLEMHLPRRKFFYLPKL